MHKRDGPKLPYPAVVIRQSAMHLKGRNAIGREGGVDPHTSSGPIPVLVCCGKSDIQASQNSGQYVTDRLGPLSATSVLLQDVRNDFRFLVASIVG
jgi:hypothetical protein